MNVNTDSIVRELENFLTRQFDDADRETVEPGSRTASKAQRTSKSMLDQFGTDLTAQARGGKLDPVIPTPQIKRVVTILIVAPKITQCLLVNQVSAKPL